MLYQEKLSSSLSPGGSLSDGEAEQVVGIESICVMSAWSVDIVSFKFALFSWQVVSSTSSWPRISVIWDILRSMKSAVMGGATSVRISMSTYGGFPRSAVEWPPMKLGVLPLSVRLSGVSVQLSVSNDSVSEFSKASYGSSDSSETVG